MKKFLLALVIGLSLIGTVLVVAHVTSTPAIAAGCGNPQGC